MFVRNKLEGILMFVKNKLKGISIFVKNKLEGVSMVVKNKKLEDMFIRINLKKKIFDQFSLQPGDVSCNLLWP